MLERISINPNVLGGKPCIRGTRISIEFILELIGSGASRDDIVRAYPQLKPEDVAAAVSYAARALTNDEFLDVDIAS